MKIKLLADYRGHLTDEVYYRSGVLEVDTDIPVDHATALLRSERAVVVEEVKPAPAPAPASVKEPAPAMVREPVKASKRKGEL